MTSQGDLRELIRGIDSRIAAVADRTGVRLREEKVEEASTRYLLFRTGDLQLALRIESLVEVGPLLPVTFLPNLPAWVNGIINLRSEIVSVIDFPHFLKMAGPTGGERMVVVKYGERKIAIRANVVYGSVARPDSALKSLEMQGGREIDTSLFTAGLIEDGRLHYVVDARRLLTAPRLLDYNRGDL